MSKSILIALCTLGLWACAPVGDQGVGISYGHKQFKPDPAMEAQMARDSARIQNAERAERKERRQENKETMMDTAKAIKKANEGGPKVIHHYRY